MARQFSVFSPFEVAMKLLKPIETKVKGVVKKTFPDPDTIKEVFFADFKTYGGSEYMSNDVYTVFDTGTVRTWYNPEITSDCRVYLCDTGEVFEIKTRPEDINMRHQFMSFKVQKIGGKP